MKICSKCGKEGKFRTVKVKDKEYELNKCRKCESESSLKWIRENPENFKKIQGKYEATEKYKEKAKLNRKKRWGLMTEDEKRKYYDKRALRVDANVEYRKLRDKYREKYGFTYITACTFGLDVAKSVYKKFNSSCAMCNAEKVLCIHHKDGVGFGNCKKLDKPVNNKLDNLLLVCRKCHMIIHKNLPHLKI